MDLVVAAYDLSKRLPPEERFGLQAHIRSAAASIPANVADGQSCGKDGRFLAHVAIAQGSLGELETHFEIARRLKFVAAGELQKVEPHLVRTGQLLHGLKRSLQKRRLATLRQNASVVLLGLLLACGLLAALG